ncbi:MAG TPA: protein translocase subunit SecF [Candidatus Andersenbacteria bacterium]|nr:MAG: hypothetical protein A2854_01610 [Parcubacteria group bacterium RIFCSPHIGHO2_01_FULL_56_18]HLD26156.1 protein translocase subunit SecF [Candidatus Andersenbacteria bacterium]
MIQETRLWLIVGVVTIAVSFVIIATLGFNLGIDFTGGSLLVIEGRAPDAEAVRTLLQEELELPVTVSLADGQYFIRTVPLTEEEHAAVVAALEAAGMFMQELRYESIGPTIGTELRRKATLSLGLVSLVIIVYLIFIFRETKGIIAGWKFGLAALYALLHDLAVVTALFVILGEVLNVVMDTLFVTAMLSLLGFSVNDTIVIFDRFKRDWRTRSSGNFLDILDRAVRACVTRSLNISFAILLVLGALFFFGGESIRWFVVALIAGTIVGTYSSLLVAPPLLYYLARR